MKAITLYQPYASLIACGVKTIETRSWSTPYRGLLAIHAAKTVPEEWEDEGDDLCRRFKNELGDRVLGDSKSLFGGAVLPRSAIVAVAMLKECLPTDDTYDDEGYLFDATARASVPGADDADTRIRVPDNDLLTGNFSEGRFGWMLTNVKPLKQPVAARGKQGLWDVDAALQALINKELA